MNTFPHLRRALTYKEIKEAFLRSVSTHCPYWRYDTTEKIWVSQKTPPCHEKICGKPECYNYGVPCNIVALRHYVLEESPEGSPLLEHLGGLVNP